MFQPLVAQVDQMVTTIDAVATKNFQWWFAALLVIGLIVIWLVSKYFTTLFKEILARLNKIEDERVALLQTQLNQNQATLHKAVEAMENMSKAMDNHTEATKEFSATMKGLKLKLE